MKRLLSILLSLTVGIAVIASASIRSRVLAQNRMTYSIVDQNSGHVALGLAIRKLSVSGTFMQAPAHPDDETNALFAMFTYGIGLPEQIGPAASAGWVQERGLYFLGEKDPKYVDLCR